VVLGVVLGVVSSTIYYRRRLIKGLFDFEYGASIFAYISNMKIEVEHVKYGLTRSGY
jgi:hypothetical protein